MGRYTRVDDILSDGLPIYQHLNGDYLYYSSSLNEWLIGEKDDESRTWVSGKSPIAACPHNTEIRWYYYSSNKITEKPLLVQHHAGYVYLNLSSHLKHIYKQNISVIPVLSIFFYQKL